MNEMQNYCGASLTQAFEGELDSGRIFAVILREEHRRMSMLGDVRRPPSVNGIAASLSRPYETVRRHIHRLAKRQLVSIASAGISLHPDVAHTRLMQTIKAELAGHLRFLISELQNAGMLSRSTPAGLAEALKSDAVAMLAALDLFLCAIEFNAPQMRNWTELAIVGATLAINVRHITREVALSRFYGSIEAIPPLEVRRPGSVRDIAAQVGLPLETVRRYLKAGVRSGILLQVGGGYVVSVDFLSSPETTGVNNRILTYSRRVLTDLAGGRYVDLDQHRALPS